ncbi:peptidylprolyl isomerase [Candidatus Woesearchaeota archaeon]|nr:peptidylprolyl isomerase [Candidatus Woesearchaeota archaeon]
MTQKPKTVKIRKKQQRKEFNPTSIFLGLAIIIAVVVIYMALSDGDAQDSTDKPAKAKDQVVATVNGEKIYKSKIDEQYNLIPAEIRALITKETILNRTIDEVLLVQEAKAKGFTATKQETEELIQILLIQNGITEDMLNQQLERNSMTMDDLKEVYTKQIMITKLLNHTVMSRAAPSEDELREYYERNMETSLITVPIQIRARHILVNNETLAQEILEQLKDGADFTELSDQYSTDTYAKQNGGDLGFFQEGMMVQPFNDAAFSMEVGDEPQIVETNFGYHILEVTGKQDAEVKTFDEVRATIEQLVKEDKESEILLDLIDELRLKADIKMNSELLVEQTEGVETFSKVQETVCTQDGKPVLRMYSTTTCPHCAWIKETVDTLFSDLVSEGKVVAYHWEVDTKDNTLTEEVETAIPQSEIMHFIQRNPEGFVPFFYLGCAYERVGNGYENENSLDKEVEEISTVVESLLSDTSNYQEETA